MAPTIRIDDEVYELLKQHAEPFVDTPNDVLRRKFGLTNGPVSADTARNSDIKGKIRAIVERIIAEDSDLDLLEKSNKAHIYFVPRSWATPDLLNGSNKSHIVALLVSNRPERDRVQVNLEVQPGDQEIRLRIIDAARPQPWFTGINQPTEQYTRISRKTLLNSEDLEAHGNDVPWIERQIRAKMAEFRSEQFPQIDAFVRSIRF